MHAVYTHHTTHITMSYINNSEEIYAAILEEDAVYNGLRRLELKVRDGRRNQRKRKQAQKNARYDQF